MPTLRDRRYAEGYCDNTNDVLKDGCRVAVSALEHSLDLCVSSMPELPPPHKKNKKKAPQPWHGDR
jgi:hypothetical protein